MAGSILDILKKTAQQGAQNAGNALFGGAPAAVGGKLSAADELAQLQKNGPPSALQYGSWQDRIDTLKKQLSAKK